MPGWMTGLIAIGSILGLSGCLWLTLGLLKQNGILAGRLGHLERQLAWRKIPGEDALARRKRLFQQFVGGNRFEAENVVCQIAYLDEYGVAGREFETDDVIVDIGAHIGTFSYLCYIQGCRAIYAYEPDVRNFELLRRNLGALEGAHLARQAVWRSDTDAAAMVMLSPVAGENTGAHTVLAHRVIDFPRQSIVDAPGPAQAAPAVPLDHILRQFERVKLLKLDCEGSEFPILLTSRELHRVEEIVGEVHEIGEDAMGLLYTDAVVPGHTAYTLDILVAELESRGFAVETRPGDSRMYLLSARRAAAL